MAGNRTTVLRRAIQLVAEADQPAVTDRDLLRRFARENDQAAFEALVHRHTAMVFGVCRRALPNVQDAEDACQATFLVLASKARGVRWQESVANWLYTTARKLARTARLAAERRAKREARVAVPEVVEPVDGMTVREWLATLDEALDNLPPHYREPLVLCYLEGLTRDEAASRLGVPPATLKVRLERGRKRLHAALTKRGCTLGVGLLALAVTSPAGASPPRLVQSILGAASGSPPATVAELVKGVAVNGAFNKAVLALAVGVVSLGVGLGAIGVSTAGHAPRVEANAVSASAAADVRAEAALDAPPAPAAPPAKEGEPLPEKFTYQGRAVGPDGKPVKDAQVFLHVLSPMPQPLVPRAKTDAEGRFSFEVKRSEFDFRSYERSPTPWRWGHLIASAPGLGVAWAQEITPGKDAELKFGADGPVKGRILNLQGEAVAGAKVRVLWVLRTQSGDLGKWQEGLKGLKDRGGGFALFGLEGLMDFALRRHGLDPAIPPATTGKDGRFTLKGVGRDRVALIRIEGEGIESRDVFVVDCPGDAISVDAFVMEGGIISAAAIRAGAQDTFLGTKFDLVVSPSRLVTGVVTDVDTGKPVAGAFVCSSQFPNGIIDRHRAWTVTDAEGRYTLRGMPAEKGSTVRVDPPAGEPYLSITAEVPDRAGLEPIRLDLRIKRGVWLTGKMRDRETKEPVQATVRYAADAENPNLKAIPGFTTEFSIRTRVDDGSFRMAILPARGYLSVTDVVPNRERYGMGGDVPADLPENLQTKPFAISPKSVNAIVPLDPAADAKEVNKEVLLTPGRGVSVTILGPDGEKLKGVIASTDPYGFRADKLNEDGTLTVRGLAARQAKYVQAVCPEKKLAGRIKVTADDKTATLKLQPWLAMKGRIVDEDGKPIADVELQFRSIRTSPLDEEPTGFWYKGTDLKTGKDGTYRIDGLVPGATYSVLVKAKGQTSRGLTVRADWKPDAVKDMGDLKPGP
jgi:RNA polymerase sigma factor (sigma-70 family)